MISEHPTTGRFNIALLYLLFHYISNKGLLYVVSLYTRISVAYLIIRQCPLLAVILLTFDISGDVIASLWVPSPGVQEQADLVDGHEDPLTWDRQKTHL